MELLGSVKGKPKGSSPSNYDAYTALPFGGVLPPKYAARNLTQDESIHG